MNWIEFTSKLIDSLAWPLALVILVLMMKDEIVKLAPSIKRLKAGPVEAEFEREVKDLVKSTPAAQEAAASTIDPASKDFLFRLAELHPRSAILEAWVLLEAAARAALPHDTTKGAMSSYVSAARLPEVLVKSNVINQAQVTLLHELRRLRNDVAHLVGLEPTQESVRSYIELASPLQSHLEAHAH